MQQENVQELFEEQKFDKNFAQLDRAWTNKFSP